MNVSVPCVDLPLGREKKETFVSSKMAQNDLKKCAHTHSLQIMKIAQMESTSVVTYISTWDSTREYQKTLRSFKYSYDKWFYVISLKKIYLQFSVAFVRFIGLLNSTIKHKIILFQNFYGVFRDENIQQGRIEVTERQKIVHTYKRVIVF